MQITIDQAEIFVNKTKNAYWDGWNIYMAWPDPSAYTNINARFMNGKWHRTRTYKMNEGGSWEIPAHYARLFQ